MTEETLIKTKVERLFKPREQLSRQIPPEPHTAMYVWHKYWSRKTWNVVGEFVKNCTYEGNIVIETCREVIAKRAEPTPYTILINYVDPVLAKMGLFGTLDTGLDVKKVLEEVVGKDFVLLKAKMGGVEGKLWWFKDPIFVARLQEVPLTERVEQTVLRVLNQRGRATFTQVWNAVSQQFPNSLTADSTSIKEALEIYARKAGAAS